MHLSLICDGNSFAVSNEIFSAKNDKFSTAVLQPLVITLAGIFFMCHNIAVDSAFKHFVKYHLIFANATFVTTSNETFSTIGKNGTKHICWR